MQEGHKTQSFVLQQNHIFYHFAKDKNKNQPNKKIHQN